MKTSSLNTLYGRSSLTIRVALLICLSLAPRLVFSQRLKIGKPWEDLKDKGNVVTGAAQAVANSVRPNVSPSIAPQLPPWAPKVPKMDLSLIAISPILPASLKEAAKSSPDAVRAKWEKAHAASTAFSEKRLAGLGSRLAQQLDANAAIKLSDTLDAQLKQITASAAEGSLTAEGKVNHLMGVAKGIADLRDSLAKTKGEVEEAKKSIKMAAMMATVEDVIYTMTEEDLQTAIRDKVKVGDYLNHILDTKLKGRLTLIDVVFPVQGLWELIDPTGIQKCIREKYVKNAGDLNNEMTEDAQGFATNVIVGCVQEHLGPEWGLLASYAAEEITSEDSDADVNGEKPKKKNSKGRTKSAPSTNVAPKESQDMRQAYEAYQETLLRESNLAETLRMMVSLEKRISDFEEIAASLNTRSPWLFQSVDYEEMPLKWIGALSDADLSRAEAELLARLGCVLRKPWAAPYLDQLGNAYVPLRNIYTGSTDEENIKIAVKRMNAFERSNWKKLVDELWRRFGKEDEAQVQGNGREDRNATPVPVLRTLPKKPVRPESPEIRVPTPTPRLRALPKRPSNPDLLLPGPN